jgi:hypothetical protein
MALEVLACVQASRRREGCGRTEDGFVVYLSHGVGDGASFARIGV